MFLVIRVQRRPGNPKNNFNPSPHRSTLQLLFKCSDYVTATGRAGPTIQVEPYLTISLLLVCYLVLLRKAWLYLLWLLLACRNSVIIIISIILRYWVHSTIELWDQNIKRVCVCVYVFLAFPPLYRTYPRHCYPYSHIASLIVVLPTFLKDP